MDKPGLRVGRGILTIDGYEGVTLQVESFPLPSTVGAEQLPPAEDFSRPKTVVMTATIPLNEIEAFWCAVLSAPQRPRKRGFLQYTGRSTYQSIAAQFAPAKARKPDRNKLTDRWGRLK